MADLGLGFLDSVEEDDSDAGWRKDIMEETAKQESGDGDIKMEDSPFTNGHSVKEEMDEVESKAFTNLSIKVDDASLQSPSCMRSPSAPPEVSTPSAELPDDTSGLSVRELNRLKRKRKHGASAVVMASSPSTSTQAPRSAAGPPPSKYVILPLLQSCKLTIYHLESAS
jgi:TATA-binding protein-associated factor